MTPERTSLEPYPGPRPFEEQDQARFFGRREEVEDLVSYVYAHRTVFVYAQSGAGKTSLLNAKVIPALRSQRFDVVHVPRPAVGLAAQAGENPFLSGTIAAILSGGDLPREISIREALKRRAPQTSDGRRGQVLVVDQSEELFTLTREAPRAREEYFAQLGDALRGEPTLRVLLAFREDHLADFETCEPFLPDRPVFRYRMERLRREAALEAVQGPLSGTGRSYAPGVAEEIVDRLRRVRVVGTEVEEEGEFVEPVYLQVVCRRLWRSLAPEVVQIEEKQLESIAGVDEALAAYYEESIRQVAAVHGTTEGVLRNWVEHQLITPERTRGSVFIGQEETGGLSNRIAEDLENAHLIRKEVRAGSFWYELTHDRLIDPVFESNKQWRAEFGEPARLWAKLGEQADIWTRDQTRTLSVPELVEAEKWLTTGEAGSLGISPDVRRFIGASRAAVSAEQTERRRITEQAASAARLRKLLYLLGGVCLAAMIALVVAIVETNSVNAIKKTLEISRNQLFKQNRDLETTSGKLKSTNTELLKKSDDLTLSEGKLKESYAALTRTNATLTSTEMELNKELDNLKNANEQIKKEQDQRVEEAAANATKQAELNTKQAELGNAAKDAREKQKRDEDENVRIQKEKDLLSAFLNAINAASPPPGWGSQAKRAVRTLTVSLGNLAAQQPPDADVLVPPSSLQALSDAVVRTLIGVTQGRKGATLAALRPNGEIVTETEPDPYRHYGRGLRKLISYLTRKTEDEPVQAVDLSLDGRWVAQGASEGYVFITNRTNFSDYKRFHPGSYSHPIDNVAFDSTGTLVATTSADGSWASIERATGKIVRRERDHDNLTTALAISRTGQISRGTRLGRILIGTAHPLMDYDSAITAMEYSPGGTSMAFAVSGGPIVCVDVSGTVVGRQQLRDDPNIDIFSLAFDSSGRLLAAGGADGKIRLYDIPHNHKILTIPAHNSAISSVRFGPDDMRLVTVAGDNEIRTWDISSAPFSDRLSGAAALSRDLLTASSGKTNADGNVSVKRSEVQRMLSEADRISSAGEPTRAAR